MPPGGGAAEGPRRLCRSIRRRGYKRRPTFIPSELALSTPLDAATKDAPTETYNRGINNKFVLVTIE